MGKPLSLENRQFGRLLAIKIVDQRNYNNVWLCKCDCDTFCKVLATYLKSGKTQSCGCLNRENTSKRFKKKNPVKKHPLYPTWCGMKQRCYYKGSIGYKNYGGRGISVCEEWRNSFKQFCDDMGDRPVGYSLDRIDVNGNYSPSNCKWSTKRDQVLNQRPRVTRQMYRELQHKYNDLLIKYQELKANINKN